MKIVSTNKKANYNYFIKEKYEAGIVLLGSEIKSIRDSKLDISNAYVSYQIDSLWINNMKIALYAKGISDYDELRIRKLLLNKREINKLKSQVTQKGMTIIPLQVYLNDRGYAKITIAVAEGKKLFDKRASIKKREWEKNKSMLMKNKNMK